MSVRIHELAKRIGIDNKELLSLLKERGFDVKTVSSAVDPISAEALETCTPVYEELDGWTESTSGATRLDDLPPAARRYLDRMKWWEQRVLAAGAIEWRGVNDLEHPERIFDARR